MNLMKYIESKHTKTINQELWNKNNTFKLVEKTVLINTTPTTEVTQQDVIIDLSAS